MTLELSEFDPAEYITEPQDVFYFLEAELELEEPAYWPGAIEIVARARGGFERLADESGIPLEILKSAADPSAPTGRAEVMRIMEAYRSAIPIVPAVAEATHAH